MIFIDFPTDEGVWKCAQDCHIAGPTLAGEDRIVTTRPNFIKLDIMGQRLCRKSWLTSEPKLWISTIRSVVCLESHDDFMIWSFPGISSHHKCWHQGPKGSSQNCQLSFVLLVSSLCGLLFSCRFKYACHAYSAGIHETSQDYFEQKQLAWCIALRNLTNMRSAIEVAPQAITPQSPTPRSGIGKTL